MPTSSCLARRRTRSGICEIAGPYRHEYLLTSTLSPGTPRRMARVSSRVLRQVTSPTTVSIATRLVKIQSLSRVRLTHLVMLTRESAWSMVAVCGGRCWEASCRETDLSTQAYIQGLYRSALRTISGKRRKRRILWRSDYSTGTTAVARARQDQVWWWKPRIIMLSNNSLVCTIHSYS